MLRRNWKTLFIVTPLASLLMANTQCTGNAPPFNWNPHIWVGDSRTQSLAATAASGGMEQMMCSDPRFDEMVAMHKSEIKKVKQAYFEVIDQCEKWKTPEAQNNAESLFEAFDALEIDPNP